ncbi:MAG: rhodanese-like domain-containing protein [Bavariicoccus seileri]|uniref:rhodanese-like domain-containing protein n=1 Tax=Bavariicoccus seileri TaxID=549685 RepID=UPI0003B3ABE7|nr:rhodanese-like domain-containing protein [Bavariicoccus seileri]
MPKLSPLTIINIILLTVVIIFGIYYLVQLYFRKKSAKLVSSEVFGDDIRKTQVVDVRETTEFHKGHILGARNIPYTQFKQRYHELRKDQKIRLYDDGVFLAGKAARILKKNGYSDIEILKSGFAAWDGKVKGEKPE